MLMDTFGLGLFRKEEKDSTEPKSSIYRHRWDLFDTREIPGGAQSHLVLPLSHGI